MFADSLLRAEQMHLFRLLVWGGASMLAGTLVVVAVARRGLTTTLLRQFGMQMMVWGALELVYVAAAWHGLGLRDLAAATRLDRLMWFNLGLDVGGVGIGAALALAGWSKQRRIGLVGAGMAVILQSAALFLINARLVALISR